MGDLIPDDVVSSAGGGTGDLWGEPWGEPPVEPWEDEARTPRAAAVSTADPAAGPAAAPAAAPAQTRAAGRARSAAKRQGGGARSERRGATGSAHGRGPVDSDTPQGKAFAEVVALFPGRVIEVLPLGRPPDTDDKGTGDETEAPFAAGYDDPMEAGSE